MIGYSLPASDAFFRDLLTLGLSGGPYIRRITVVDPSRDVMERFQALLGQYTRAKFDPRLVTFEDYAKQTLGAGRRLPQYSSVSYSV